MDAAMATYIEARIRFRDRPNARIAVREISVMGGPVLVVHVSEDFGQFGGATAQHPVPIFGEGPAGAVRILRLRWEVRAIGPMLRAGLQRHAQALVWGRR